MRLSARVSRRAVLIGALVVLLLSGAAAFAATTFPDVPSTYWAHDSIIKLADQEIIKGHTDGTFGPEESITRAQAAVMLDRDQEYILAQAEANVEEAMTAPMDPVRRGCPACHPDQLLPENPAGAGRPDPTRGDSLKYSLKWEAMGGDSGAAQFALHGTLPDTAGVTACLGCHAAGDAEQNGTVAPISLRVIVHPAHMNSGIFLTHYRGNCFTCHDVINDGEFYLLTQPVDVNDKGIPEELPIPGMQESSSSDD